MVGEDRGLVRYGIGEEYLPDWGIQEALREIFQNFKDFGEFTKKVDVSNSVPGSLAITLTNSYDPGDSGNFLRIGKSYKRGDPDKIGQHGEGLKMAALVLLRNGCDMTIQHNSIGYKPVWYDDKHLGRCFGLSVRQFLSGSRHYNFRVYFSIDTEEWEKWEASSVTEEEVLYTCYAGKVIDKKPGDVYVGGFFVSNISGLTRAYDFPPRAVPLDRDRKVPKEFDVVWAAGQILSGWEGTTAEDLTTMDARYISSLPPKLAKSFVPSVDPITGKAEFSSDGVPATSRVADILMQDTSTQKKVAKLRYEMTRKRKPTSLLKELRERHRLFIQGSLRADLDLLILKSKTWKA